LGYALRGEEAFQIEFAICVFLVPAALWLGHTGLEKAVLIMSLLIVLITELLNTGIEVAIDRIGKEFHELSGRAKDVGSAAVHLSLLQVPLIWGLVLFG
jgi:diacylglycerol kinase (ATP)